MKLSRVVMLLVFLAPPLLMGSSSCGSGGPAAFREYECRAGRVDTLTWSPDGTWIYFNYKFPWGEGIYAVASDGSYVNEIVEGSVHEEPWVSNISPRLSPDGTRIAYAVYNGNVVFGHKWDIYTARVDGSDRSRLTKDGNLDTNPVWSPDGSRIAFVSGRKYEGTTRRRVYTMKADGSDVRMVAAPTAEFADEIKPPAWSPDGHQIAFTAEELYYSVDGDTRREYNLYVVGADGSNLRNVGKAHTSPVWSPDGQRLAFVNPTGIYTVRPDGTDLARILNRSVSQLSWSSDGSELQFSDDGIYAVGPDGSGLRLVFPYSLPDLYAWSPDGSRVAFQTGGLAFTAARDGTDLRAIARLKRPIWGELRESWSNSRELVRPPEWVAVNLERGSPSVNVAPCSAGFVVPEPEENPRLVQDCETLLTIRDLLAETVELNWNTDIPIDEWEGVAVDGSPLRVHELILPDHGLDGVFPSELGRLTALKRLDLSSGSSTPYPKFNAVTGAIPGELGGLVELEELRLDGNSLSGHIPPELGELSHLKALELSRNFLSGPMPPEFGNLQKLESLNLGSNYLTGSILPDFGRLESLSSLDLSHNYLTGPIPPELGGARGLQTLRLSENHLIGGIPPEMGNLEYMNSLLLWPNDLSGCVPAELNDIWVYASKLERCKPDEGASL